MASKLICYLYPLLFDKPFTLQTYSHLSVTYLCCKATSPRVKICATSSCVGHSPAATHPKTPHSSPIPDSSNSISPLRIPGPPLTPMDNLVRGCLVNQRVRAWTRSEHVPTRVDCSAQRGSLKQHRLSWHYRIGREIWNNKNFWPEIIT